MLDHQIYRANAMLHSPLPHNDWTSFNCPTVVAVPITPNNRVVMVQPICAHPHGWIFPQGKIEQRNETLFQAAVRVLQAELGFPPDTFDQQTARLIGEAAVKFDQGKQYYVVALPMKRRQQPRLNGENRNCCLVGGPGQLLHNIGECSKPKLELIKHLLLTAIEQHLLYKGRWTADHVNLVIRSS